MARAVEPSRVRFVRMIAKSDDECFITSLDPQSNKISYLAEKYESS